MQWRKFERMDTVTGSLWNSVLSGGEDRITGNQFYLWNHLSALSEAADPSLSHIFTVADVILCNRMFWVQLLKAQKKKMKSPTSLKGSWSQPALCPKTLKSLRTSRKVKKYWLRVIMGISCRTVFYVEVALILLAAGCSRVLNNDSPLVPNVLLRADCSKTLFAIINPGLITFVVKVLIILQYYLCRSAATG